MNWIDLLALTPLGTCDFAGPLADAYRCQDLDAEMRALASRRGVADAQTRRPEEGR